MQKRRAEARRYNQVELAAGLPALGAKQEIVFMWNALRYYWIVARGYRLRPWRSPYLQWRLETFLGKEAENLNASRFFKIAWKYREQMQSFADWAAERRRVQSRLRPQV